MSGFGLRLIGVYLLVTGACLVIPFLMRLDGVAREMWPLYKALVGLGKIPVGVPLSTASVWFVFWLFEFVSEWKPRVSSQQDTVSSFKDTRPEGYKDPYQLYLEQGSEEKIAQRKLEEEKREAEARERRRLQQEQRRIRSPEEATEAALRDPVITARSFKHLLIQASPQKT